MSKGSRGTARPARYMSGSSVRMTSRPVRSVGRLRRSMTAQRGNGGILIPATIRRSSKRTCREPDVRSMESCRFRYRGRRRVVASRSNSSGRSEPIIEVAKTIKSYLWGILNAIRPKTTNAELDSMNSGIQRIKRMACGFRNRERFRMAILFHFGGLDLGF